MECRFYHLKSTKTTLVKSFNSTQKKSNPGVTTQNRFEVIEEEEKTPTKQVFQKDNNEPNPTLALILKKLEEMEEKHYLDNLLSIMLSTLMFFVTSTFVIQLVG